MDPFGLRPGERAALVAADGSELSYRSLLRIANGYARLLPATRRGLVALVGDREPGTVAAYLAALKAGHAVAWTGPPRTGGGGRDLVERFAPEIVIGPPEALRAVLPPGRYRPLDDGSVTYGVCAAARAEPRPADLHPGTDLLMVTSGSISGGRGVRLSGAALRHNAEAIREALAITAGARGATSLPLHYSYGLSVLNSHLSAGASLLLDTSPPTGARFWRAFAGAGCDTFAGLPLHADWLTRTRLPWDGVASLRAFTAAGGRLPTPVARDLHLRLDKRGARLLKMYGQTEATARITDARRGPARFEGRRAAP